MFKKLWKTTLAFTLMCTQVYQGSMAVFASEVNTKEDSSETLPNLQDGEVNSTKTAKWVDPENGIAEITFDVMGKSKQQPLDIVVVYDNSSSMIYDDADHNYLPYRKSAWYQAQQATKIFFDSMLQGDNENRVSFVPFSDTLFDEITESKKSVFNNVWNTYQWLYLKKDNQIDKKGDPDIDAMIGLIASGLGIDADGKFTEYALNNILPRYGYKKSDIVEKDFSSKEIGLTNDIESLKTAVNTLFPSGGTVYSSALQHANDYLTAEDNNHKKLVLFVSDGQPNPDDRELSLEIAQEMKDAGITIYTVGANIAEDADNALPLVASTDDNGLPLYVSADSSELIDVFANIAGDMKIAGTNAQIIDEIKTDYYDYYEDATYYPTVDGLQVTEPVFTIEESNQKSTITWKLGNITETKHTLKFYVKIKDEYRVSDDIYPTNGNAQLEYKDYENKDMKVDMESPKLATKTGIIIKENYLVNAQGNYLDADGNITTDKTKALFLTEEFTKQEVGKEISVQTNEIQQNNHTYKPLEDEKKVTLKWLDGSEQPTETVAFNYVIEYPIHFFSEGLQVDEKTGVYGSAVGDASTITPVKPGHTFIGWFSEQNGAGYAYDANHIVKGEETYYAAFVPNPYSYTVEYYKQSLDGSYYRSSDSYTAQGEYEQIIKAEGSIIKEFTGYTYDPTNANAISEIQVTEDGKATLKLYYDLNAYNYTIQYVYDGINGEKIEGLTAKYGETITAFEEKDQYGKYHLVGTPSVTISDDENIMYVNYEINTYRVEFVDAMQTIKSDLVKHGDKTSAPTTDPERIGFTFIGWVDEYNKPFDADKAVVEDATYYAIYTRNEYAYTVEYYKQSLDGSYYRSSDSYTAQGKYEQTIKAEGSIIKEFTGYTYDPTNANAISEIQVTEDGKATLKLYYDLNAYNYTIQYVYDGIDGEKVEGLTAKYGETITTFEEKNQYGKYHLVGTPSVTISDGENIMYVNYEINTYDVNFYDEDGSLISSNKVNHGETTTAPADPSKEGYHFTGWLDKEGDTFDPSKAVIESNDYYAHYEINKFDVNFYDEDGSLISSNKVNHGETTAAPADPSKEGYHFTGWLDKEGNTFDPSKAVIESNDYYAQYEINSYPYKVQHYLQNVDGSYTLKDEIIPSEPATYGTTIYDVDHINTYPYYHFNEDAENAVRKATVINNDAVLKLYYDLNAYNYTIQYVYDGIDGEKVEGLTAKYGETITTFEEKDQYGKYHLVGTPSVTISDGENIMYVNYEINTYRVEFVDAMQTIKSDLVKHGDKASAPATDPERIGFTFIGWVDEYNKPFDADKAVVEDATYYAIYTRNEYAYTIEYYKQSLDGSYYRSSDSYTAQGEYEQIIKAEGSIIKEFTGYTYDPTNANAISEIQVTEDGKATLKLYYDLNTYNYTIQYVYDGIDGEKVEGLTAKYGETITAFEEKDQYGKYHLVGTPSVTISDGENIMYVNYEINKYDVNFYDEDGSLISSNKVNHGETTTAPANPSKEGYHFTGWSDKEGNTFDPSKAVIESNDYYAQYEINSYPYKVQHYLQNVDGSYTLKDEIIPSEPATYGTTIYDVDHINTYPYYHFNEDAENAVRNVVVTDQNAVLKLYYDMDEIAYEVHYFFDGIYDASLDEHGVGHISQVINQFIDKNKEGYHLANVPSLTLKEQAEENILEVHYVVNEYHVYFVVDQTVIKTEIVKYGQDAHQPNDPEKDGYTFIGWDRSFQNIKQDTTVYAMFEEVKPILHTVNFYTPDGILIDMQSVEHGKGAIAPTDFLVPEGYIFTGWDQSFDVVNSDLDVYAIYEKIGEPQPETHTVIFLDQNGHEISKQEVNHGESAIAPLPPKVEGYDFVAWDKDFTNVVTDLIITAEYKVQEFTVLFVGRYGELIDRQVVAYGKDAIAPQPLSYDNAQFIGWNKTFTNVKEDLIVTALYEDILIPNPPIEPSDPIDPITPVGPVPPTPIVVDPTPTPPITPITPTPEPTPEPTPDKEQGEVIDDNQTPLAGPSTDGCWVHWVMLLLTILYAMYAAIRIFFRANHNANLKDDQDDLAKELEHLQEGVPQA